MTAVVIKLCSCDLGTQTEYNNKNVQSREKQSLALTGERCYVLSYNMLSDYKLVDRLREMSLN